MSRERGVATLGAALIGLCLVVIAMVLAEVTALIALRHRAASAADLAALAGSQASVAGADGCAAARSVARRNGGRLVDCRMDFDVATVRVRVDSHRWLGQAWAAEQRARATPADYVPAKGPES